LVDAKRAAECVGEGWETYRKLFGNERGRFENGTDWEEGLKGQSCTKNIGP